MHADQTTNKHSAPSLFFIVRTNAHRRLRGPGRVGAGYLLLDDDDPEMEFWSSEPIDSASIFTRFHDAEKFASHITQTSRRIQAEVLTVCLLNTGHA